MVQTNDIVTYGRQWSRAWRSLEHNRMWQQLGAWRHWLYKVTMALFEQLRPTVDALQGLAALQTWTAQEAKRLSCKQRRAREK
eukprot:171816-Karenia_brevis.AAC.1